MPEYLEGRLPSVDLSDPTPAPTPFDMMPLAPRVPREFWGNINFVYKDGRLDAVHVHQTARA